MISILNPHEVGCADFVEQADDLDIVHLHTAATGGVAEPLFVVGATEIHLAFVVAAGIHGGLESEKTQNPVKPEDDLAHGGLCGGC